MSKIAIWVPVYNEGEFLHDTIFSILSQSYTNFDLIISNNHSTDNTNEIIQQFLDAGSNIILWSPPEYCPSLEHVDFIFAKLKQSEYDGFIHVGGHDILERNFVELLVAAWSKHPNAAVISGMDVVLSRTGEIVGEYTGKTPQIITRNRIFNPFSILTGTNSNVAMHGILPASIMKKVNFRYRCSGADVLYIAEASLYGDIIYVPDAIIQKRDLGQGAKEYLSKHMGVESTDRSAMVRMMNLQMKYISDITDLALAGFPEDIKNIYRASLMGAYFLKWCTADFLNGSLDTVGDIVSSYLSHMNHIGATTNTKLTEFLNGE